MLATILHSTRGHLFRVLCIYHFWPQSRQSSGKLVISASVPSAIAWGHADHPRQWACQPVGFHGQFDYRAEQMPTSDYEAVEFTLALKPSLLPAKSPQAHFNRLLVSFLGLTYRWPGAKMPFAAAAGDGDGVTISQGLLFPLHRFIHQSGSRYLLCQRRNAVIKKGEWRHIKLYWTSCIIYPVHVHTLGQYL